MTKRYILQADDVVDNLTSTDQSIPLSANQGRVLNTTKQNIIQVSTMPSAIPETVGKIVQYIGATTADFTNGYFYQCIADSTSAITVYRWTSKNVQSAGISGVEWGSITGTLSNQTDLKNELDDRTPTVMQNTLLFGSYFPISTYAELISALSVSNQKPLKLIENLSATSSLTISSTNTIDLNGHYINGGTRVDGFTISGGDITILDSVGTGSINGFIDSCITIAEGGAFTMNGGTIRECYGMLGGGVCIASGTFTMTGGSITNCSAQFYGGGVYNSSGPEQFIWTGGTIINNTPTNTDPHRDPPTES